MIDFDAAQGLYHKVCEEEQTTGRARNMQTFQNAEHIADIIEKLKHLKESGVLTEEEFQTQKQKLLDRL